MTVDRESILTRAAYYVLTPGQFGYQAIKPASSVAKSTLCLKNQLISAGNSRICGKTICSTPKNDPNVDFGSGHMTVEIVEGQESWIQPREPWLNTRRQTCQRALKHLRCWGLLPLLPPVAQRNQNRLQNQNQCRFTLNQQWVRCKTSPGRFVLKGPISPPRGPGHLNLGRLSCLTQSKLSWSSGPHSFFLHVLKKSQLQNQNQWSWKNQLWKRCNIFSGSAHVADPIHPVCLSAAPAGFLLPDQNLTFRGHQC